MNQKKLIRTLLCLVLVMLLAAAVFAGCKKNEGGGAATADETVDEIQSATESDLAGETPSNGDEGEIQDSTELGSGEKTIYFQVTDKAGQTTSYTIHTDAETVGEALLENELIEGEESEYGLYVTTVGGETLDWDTDGMYWAFYENGEYAMTGVDATAITDGASYALAATAG